MILLSPAAASDVKRLRNFLKPRIQTLRSARFALSGLRLKECRSFPNSGDQLKTRTYDK